MFDHLFENRNTTVTHLLKLGDCLGRSLRENIEIFSIDSEKNNVAYLTEKGKVLSGNYVLGLDIILENIKVQNSEIFTDNKIFDSFVNEKVSYFVGELNSNKYSEANTSFSDILSLWENRLKFENVKKRLQEKSAVFSEDSTIIKTDQFQRFLEVTPQFVEFLTENKESILQVQEIENAIKLSNAVSTAFNFPRLTYKTLEEDGSYKISKGLNKSVYDLICKQELVKKELLESKKNFEDVWATNAKIRNLASLIFNEADEAVLEALVEAVIEIPYLALTTKKQLFESVENAFTIGDNTPISHKELKTFVSKLFEMKKPIKQVVISLLNEKYGINVQNLKETATFKGLANTQVVIFEALTRLAPKGSVVKETLSGLSKMLKSKNGVEVIDVNELLQECFETCGYDAFCTDFAIAEELSFETILDESVNVAELLEKTRERLLLDKKKKKKKGKKDTDEEPPAANTDNRSPEDDEHIAQCKSHEKSLPGVHGEEEDDSVRAAMTKKTATRKEDVESESNADLEEQENGAESSEPSVEDGKAPEEPKELSKEDFLEALKSMDDLLSGLSEDDAPFEDDKDESDTIHPKDEGGDDESTPQTDTEKAED
jgi:hypothetical protein